MKKHYAAMALIIILFLFFCPTIFAGQFSNKPTLKDDGSKWRTCYLQGGEYKDYQAVTASVIRELTDLGWIQDQEIPKFTSDEGTAKLWEWLSEPNRSEYLEFVKDCYFSAGWDEPKREENKKAIIERLNSKKDIDLVFALGTWAGQDLSNDQHSTPTLVFSSSDPLASNIVKSVEDSGYDHIWARLDPTRFERQIDVFHDIIGFEKLGIVYEDTPSGQSYCSLDKIEAAAKIRGFELIPCNALFSSMNKGAAARNVVECHKKLAPEIDALYITHHRGIIPRYMARLMAPLNEHQVPTFSQMGADEVRLGALLSISQANFKYVGKFYAETVAQVLNGAKPRELPQVFESPPKIAINLETAETIGWDPPVDILGAADEIFEDTEIVEQDS